MFAGVPTTGLVATVERLVAAFDDKEQVSARASLADALAGVITQRGASRASRDERPICEVIVANPSVASAIRDGKARDLSSS